MCSKFIFDKKRNIIKSAGIVNPVPFSNNKINMLNNGDVDQYVIQDLYEQYHVSTQPERFRIILLHFSENQQNTDISELQESQKEKKLEELFYQYITQWNIYISTKNMGNYTTNCCCSHVIHRLYYIYNRFNGNILLVGSICIKKVFERSSKLGRGTEIPLHLEYKKVSRLIKHYKKHGEMPKDITTIDNCKKCNVESVVNSHNMCEKCSKKKCLGCGELFYINDNNSWYKYCSNCFRENHVKKMCKICGVLFNVNKEEANWKKLCSPCYAKTK